MGLAASQARFLGITARKSNIEYEGQQVNQQRTALAQEVNALYNKLLALDTPIAPDTTDFYETNYSFEVTNTIGSDGKYIINSYYPSTKENYYNISATRTYKKTVAEGKVYKQEKIVYNDATGQYIFTDEKGNQQILTANAENSATMVALINDTYYKDTPEKQLSADEKLYYYQKDGQTYYIPSSQLTAEEFSVYCQTEKELTEDIAFEAMFELDNNGRISKISNAIDPTTGKELNFNTEVDTTRVHNDEGYQAALRDYTMSKDEYDKAVADLNAQTETLQQEDKVLELRLNQIDTEQNELQTELEAVKAILEKNIENTFKTFA